MKNSIKVSENADNAYVCLKNCLSNYEKAEKLGFQNISPRYGRDIGYETMFVLQMFPKEISELELTDDEKITLEMAQKFILGEYVDPIDEHYHVFTIWKNKSGDLKYTLEDARERSKKISDKTFEKTSSQLVPSLKHFGSMMSILLKLSEKAFKIE